MSRIYMGRRHREQLAAMKHALAQNKDKGAQAMTEALAKVAECGRAVGAALANTRKAPLVVPGRVRPKPATPASSEPERGPAVVVPGRRIRPAAAPVPQPVVEIAPAPEPEPQVVVVSPEQPKPAVPVVITPPVRRVVNPDHEVCKDPKGRVVAAFAVVIQHHFDHEYRRELEEYERYIAAVG